MKKALSKIALMGLGTLGIAAPLISISCSEKTEILKWDDFVSYASNHRQHIGENIDWRTKSPDWEDMLVWMTENINQQALNNAIATELLSDFEEPSQALMDSFTLTIKNNLFMVNYMSDEGVVVRNEKSAIKNKEKFDFHAKSRTEYNALGCVISEITGEYSGDTQDYIKCSFEKNEEMKRFFLCVEDFGVLFPED